MFVIFVKRRIMKSFVVFLERVNVEGKARDESKNVSDVSAYDCWNWCPDSELKESVACRLKSW